MRTYYQVAENGFNGCTDWSYLLQRALVLEGCGSFSPTGNFGPLTLAAVIKYQIKHGITPNAGYCESTAGRLTNLGLQSTARASQNLKGNVKLVMRLRLADALLPSPDG